MIDTSKKYLLPLFMLLVVYSKLSGCYHHYKMCHTRRELMQEITPAADTEPARQDSLPDVGPEASNR